MRVLITGALGFVGRHLTSLCAQSGATVIGAGRPVGAHEPPTGLDRYLELDLRDASATRACMRAARPERVFHLAAEASVAASWSHPGGVLVNNVSTTANVLDAVMELAPEARVLTACSGDEYGPVAGERLPVTEQHPLRPQSPYAVSKAAADLLAGFYADAHGLTVLRARAFNHAGPGQGAAYVVASLARQIAAAEATGQTRLEVVTGNLCVRRDFADVRDVVRAYWLALERSATAGAYNVCSGESVAVADILATLDSETGLEVVQRTDDSLVRAREVLEIRGSHAKLTEATGWEPEIPLAQTLRDTLDLWREQARAEERRG